MQRAFVGIIATLVPVVLILTGARCAMTAWFLKAEYGRSAFPRDQYGLSSEERLDYSVQTIAVLLDHPNVTSLRGLTFGAVHEPGRSVAASEQPDVVFNERELRHLADVQGLVQNGWKLWIWASIVLATSVAWATASGRKDLVLRGAALGSRITLALIAVLLFCVTFGFQRSFVLLHHLMLDIPSSSFFEWDSLIRLFPERLFADASLLSASIAAAGAIVVACAAWLASRPTSWTSHQS